MRPKHVLCFLRYVLYHVVHFFLPIPSYLLVGPLAHPLLLSLPDKTMQVAMDVGKESSCLLIRS